MALPVTFESVGAAAHDAVIVLLCQLLDDPRRQCKALGLAVSLFDAASFQHSPANMAFFSLAAGMGIGPGWSAALGWSIVPAALGNILGGFLLVVVPFWIAFGSKHRAGGSGAQPDAR